MERVFTAVIADDEPAILSNLQNSPIWNDLGIKIISSASDGEECFESILRLKPDFAVVDIRMPKLSGLDVIKKCSEAGLQTQIIIISGYNEFTYAKEAIKYGAKAYILKPIDQTELREELMILKSKLDNSIKATDPTKYSTSFFKDLIEGRITDSSIIARMLPTLDSKLTDTDCFVLRIVFKSDLTNVHYSSFNDLLNTTLTSLRFKHIYIDKNSVAIIINIANITPFEVAQNLINALDNHNFPKSIIGIGDIVPGLYQCPYSSSRAMITVAYSIYDTKRRIFTYLDICTVAPPSKAPYDAKQMSQAIIEIDKEKITQLIEDYISSVCYVPMPSPNYLYSHTNTFVQMVISELNPVLHESPIRFSISNITNKDSLEEIKKTLLDFFLEIANYLLQIYGPTKPRLIMDQANGLYDEEEELIKNAKLYIKENISSGIQISDIADNANLSPTYFAIYFKNKTGETLRDYLLKEKMEWAGRRLTKGEDSVEEIATSLGYSDYHAFSRAFKKVYGEAPSTFRDKIKKWLKR